MIKAIETLYTCPSCGYQTKKKTDMRRHLYRSKRPCQNVNGVELTDEIREYILKNKVVANNVDNNVVKEPQYIVNNYINNLNQFSVYDKINGFLKHNETTLQDYQDKVLTMFEETTDKLEFDSNYDLAKDSIYKLDDDDFLDIINQTCKVRIPTLDDFNMFYDPKLDYLSIVENGEWKDSLLRRGIKQVIETIQLSYLNVYEKYLLRRIYFTTSPRLKQVCEELLQVYYSFISSFDIEPYVKDKSDDDILDNGKINKYDLGEKIYAKYKDVKSNLKDATKRSRIAAVVKVIQKNSKINLYNLDQKVSFILKQNVDFVKYLEPIQSGESSSCE
jgi:hypothetical protein